MTSQNIIKRTHKIWANVHETAKHIGLSVDSLNRDRCTKLIGIPYTKIGKRVLYDLNEVDAFLSAHMVRTEEVRK
jgi:hypothetical protein